MAAKDEIETERAEFKDVVLLIEKNLYSHHPNTPLPDNPFFLQVINEATPLLRHYLVESGHDHKQFAKLVARKVLKLKQLECEFNIRRATSLADSIEINNLKEKILKMQNTSTILQFKVVKSHSLDGPLTIKIKGSNSKDLKLEEGDISKLEVKLTDVFNADFISDDGSQHHKIDSTKIQVSDLIDKICPKRAAENAYLEEMVQKKGVNFEVKIETRLTMSVQDRIRLLNKKSSEVEEATSERDKNAGLYKDIQNSLLITFDEDEQSFKSSLRNRKKQRENCCEACQLF